MVSRLRSTWLASHLAANTPLPLIMRAAGLKGVRPLEDLLNFAPCLPGRRGGAAVAEGGLALVRPRDLREAVAWVDRSGIAPLIEDILRPTRRGRPRQLTVRTLFVGMKLAVDARSRRTPSSRPRGSAEDGLHDKTITSQMRRLPAQSAIRRTPKR